MRKAGSCSRTFQPLYRRASRLPDGGKIKGNGRPSTVGEGKKKRRKVIRFRLEFVFQLREIGIRDKERLVNSAEQICYVTRTVLLLALSSNTRHNGFLSFNRILSRFMKFRARTMPSVDSCLVEKSCNGVSRKHVAKGGVTRLHNSKNPLWTINPRRFLPGRRY